MGKPKMTALAVVLRAIEPLSDEEKQTLRDVLRPALKPRSKPKPERKLSQKRKAQTVSVASETTAGIPSDARCAKPDCVGFSDDNIHHKQSMPGYHEFVEPASEAKGAGV